MVDRWIGMTDKWADRYGEEVCSIYIYIYGFTSWWLLLLSVTAVEIFQPWSTTLFIQFRMSRYNWISINNYLVL